MPTAINFLIQLRDETAINEAALASVRDQMLERCAVVQAWPPSPIRTTMIARLDKGLKAIPRLIAALHPIQAGAQQSAGALGGNVPPPTPPPPIPTGGDGALRWSTTPEW